MVTKTLKPAAEPKTSPKTSPKISFEFNAPSASSVALAGTFNGWSSEKNLLKRDANGCWKLSLALKPGRYEYRYAVDGTWQNEQHPCECVPNAFGSWNCVIEVK